MITINGVSYALKGDGFASASGDEVTAEQMSELLRKADDRGAAVSIDKSCIVPLAKAHKLMRAFSMLHVEHEVGALFVAVLGKTGIRIRFHARSEI